MTFDHPILNLEQIQIGKNQEFKVYLVALKSNEILLC
jgi:hypothetical protein